jgi:quinol-cytochrome oxidoreductase complex cytochrome b subunit
VIVLLEPEAGPETVREVVRAIEELGLQAVPLDDAKGGALEVIGAERGRALELRGTPGIQEILTRRTALVGGEPLWPHGVLRLAIMAVPLVVVILLLSVIFPPPLGDRVDPAALEGPRVVEWYLRPVTAVLHAFPAGASFVGSVIIALYWILLFLWPFVDRADPQTPRGRRVALAVRVMGIAVIVLLVLLVVVWRP